MKRFNLTKEERASKISNHIHLKLPHTISIVALQGQCNLKCRMCPMFNTTFHKIEVMDLSIVERLIDQIPDDGCHHIELTAMGEPLLHPRIEDLIEMVVGNYKKNRTLLVTNGHRLDNRMAELILDCDIDQLQISINAYGEKKYKWFTGSSEYLKVVSNIENFVRLKQKRNSGLPYITLHIAGIKEFSEDFKPFIDFWKDKVELVRVREVKDWSGITSNNGISSLLTEEISCTRYPCSWLWESIEIYPTGDVYTCSFHPFFKTPPMGNLLESSLHEMWHGELIRSLREKHLAGKAHEIDFCDKCTNWYLYPNFWHLCTHDKSPDNDRIWFIPELEGKI